MANGRFDRTEVDMRWGDLLIEAKLTETDFQSCKADVVATYRDFDTVFDRELLPRADTGTKRRRSATEFPEDYSQELESYVDLAGRAQGNPAQNATGKETAGGYGRVAAVSSVQSGYASYQLIRNVLAAYAARCSFCVLHDERRPDLREAWFWVMKAVKSAEMRGRLKVLTWQELASLLPEGLQQFLDVKYGIVGPGCETLEFT
jgi:hypothetical protein